MYKRLPPGRAGLGSQVAICIKIDEVCIKIDEFCIKNDEFCIQNDGLLRRPTA